MSERAAQTFREGALSAETVEPSQPSEPGRTPGPTPDLASTQPALFDEAVAPVDLDLTIGAGEDPGWTHGSHPDKGHARQQRRT